MSLYAVCKFIVSHPFTRYRRLDAFLRFSRWQIGSRILGSPIAVKFVDNARLLVSPGMTGATGNIYCGLHEFEDMGFVLHFLRSGDLFVDIGANIGSYTILASVTGANVVSFEPVPATFERLLDNIHLNRLETRVEARNQAVGSASGEMDMIVDQDTTNQALHAEERYMGKTQRVPVGTLDEVLGGKIPKLIKIDVEGFETEVLAGAKATIAHPGLMAVIIELNGSGNRFGFDEESLHQHMLDLGFHPCRYEPFTRTLIDLEGRRSVSGNTLYLRNPETAQAHVHSSPTYEIHGIDL